MTLKKTIGQMATAVIAATLLVSCVGSTEDGDPAGSLDEAIDISPENMIDDLEDNDDEIIMQEDRGGSWYAYNDGTAGTQTPGSDSFTATEGGADGTSYAANTNGGGFTEWGAGMAFALNDDGVTMAAYDASAFAGIAFWAKGNTSIRVSFPITAVIPPTEGGTCDDEIADNCYNTHGANISLTDSWKPYAVPFASIAQEEGWGLTAGFDPAEVIGIEFSTGPNVDFDIWIDEIGFYTADQYPQD